MAEAVQRETNRGLRAMWMNSSTRQSWLQNQQGQKELENRRKAAEAHVKVYTTGTAETARNAAPWRELKHEEARPNTARLDTAVGKDIQAFRVSQ